MMINDLKKGYTKMKFGDCAYLVRKAFNPRSGEAKPYIGLAHINKGSLKLNSIGSSKDVSSGKLEFAAGDILFGKIRAYFRKVVRPNFDGVCSTDIFVVRSKKGIDQSFLFYWMGSQEFISIATASSTGTKMPRAVWEHLERIDKYIPNINTQQKIASILSAYDDLIEINDRKIKILEEMTRLIYKEWFVKFRFPGYEKVKMVQSGVGKIPKGWGICDIGSIGKVITGKTPSTKEVDNFGDYTPFITIPDMHNKIFVIKTERYLSKKGVIKQSNKTLPQNAICVSCIATMGLVVITTENSQTNQQINSVVLDDLSTLEYLFFVLKSLRTKITLYGGSGTAANILNKEKFSKLKIVNPEKKIIEQFHCLIEPIFKQIENIMRQNNILRQTRDMLLPKLISGEIEV